MIELIICLLIPLLIAFGIGMVYSQHSVWLSLREKGHVTIDDWYYTAVKINKRWN